MLRIPQSVLPIVRGIRSSCFEHVYLDHDVRSSTCLPIHIIVLDSHADSAQGDSEAPVAVPSLTLPIVFSSVNDSSVSATLMPEVLSMAQACRLCLRMEALGRLDLFPEDWCFQLSVKCWRGHTTHLGEI